MFFCVRHNLVLVCPFFSDCGQIRRDAASAKGQRFGKDWGQFAHQFSLLDGVQTDYPARA
jgi:hypothetical protein